MFSFLLANIFRFLSQDPSTSPVQPKDNNDEDDVDDDDDDDGEF